MAHTLIRNTSNAFNFKQEKGLYNLILSKRGFSEKDLSKVLGKIKAKNKKDEKFNETKKYSGKVTFDKNTTIHNFVTNLIKKSKLPETLRMPVLVGYKKTKSYVF